MYGLSAGIKIMLVLDRWRLEDSSVFIKKHLFLLYQRLRSWVPMTVTLWINIPVWRRCKFYLRCFFYSHFFEVCLECNNRIEAEKYVSRVLLEKKVTCYVKLGWVYQFIEVLTLLKGWLNKLTLSSGHLCCDYAVHSFTPELRRGHWIHWPQNPGRIQIHKWLGTITRVLHC